MFRSGRSPPSNLNEKNSDWRKEHFFISFKDGQGKLCELEVSEQIYKTFDQFELDDLVYLNVWDRHIEQSEVKEGTLNKRVFHKPENLEESMLGKIEKEHLHSAILNCQKSSDAGWFYIIFMI